MDRARSPLPYVRRHALALIATTASAWGLDGRGRDGQDVDAAARRVTPGGFGDAGRGLGYARRAQAKDETVVRVGGPRFDNPASSVTSGRAGGRDAQR